MDYIYPYYNYKYYTENKTLRPPEGYATFIFYLVSKNIKDACVMTHFGSYCGSFEPYIGIIPIILEFDRKAGTWVVPYNAYQYMPHFPQIKRFARYDKFVEIVRYYPYFLKFAKRFYNGEGADRTDNDDSEILWGVSDLKSVKISNVDDFLVPDKNISLGGYDIFYNYNYSSVWEEYIFGDGRKIVNYYINYPLKTVFRQKITKGGNYRISKEFVIDNITGAIYLKQGDSCVLFAKEPLYVRPVSGNPLAKGAAYQLFLSEYFSRTTYDGLYYPSGYPYYIDPDDVDKFEQDSLYDVKLLQKDGHIFYINYKFKINFPENYHNRNYYNEEVEYRAYYFRDGSGFQPEGQFSRCQNKSDDLNHRYFKFLYNLNLDVIKYEIVDYYRDRLSIFIKEDVVDLIKKLELNIREENYKKKTYYLFVNSFYMIKLTRWDVYDLSSGEVQHGTLLELKRIISGQPLVEEFEEKAPEENINLLF
jgi:hypothetical protein